MKMTTIDNLFYKSNKILTTYKKCKCMKGKREMGLENKYSISHILNLLLLIYKGGVFESRSENVGGVGFVVQRLIHSGESEEVGGSIMFENKMRRGCGVVDLRLIWIW